MAIIHSKRCSKGKRKVSISSKKSKRVGGGCGCGKTVGGKSKKSKSASRKNKSRKIGGFGPASYQSFDQHAGNVTDTVIPFPANLNNDPNMPSNMRSEHITYKGGKKNKNKKQRGGNLLLGSSPYTNNIANAGTLDNATTGANTVLGGITNMNYAEYSQPVDAKFHMHNLPIV